MYSSAYFKFRFIGNLLAIFLRIFLKKNQLQGEMVALYR